MEEDFIDSNALKRNYGWETVKGGVKWDIHKSFIIGIEAFAIDYNLTSLILSIFV